MLTLRAARRMLWPYASNVAYENADAQDIADFDLRLAVGLERLFIAGTWKSMWREITLTVYSDDTHGALLTLPRGFETVEQFKPVCGIAQPVYSRFHQFPAFSIVTQSGTIRQGWIPCHRGLKLFNDSAQTFRIPEGDFKLRAGIPAPAGPGVPPSPKLYLSGGWTGEEELFGDVTLDLLSNETTTFFYSQMPFIRKDVTDQAVKLYAVDADDNATLIAVYAPGETTPEYRQYRISGSEDETTVVCICKLRLTIPSNDNDIVIPNNINALTEALYSIQYRDRNDHERERQAIGPNYPQQNAGVKWGAIDWLDAELQTLSESEIPAFEMSGYGAGDICNVI